MQRHCPSQSSKIAEVRQRCWPKAFCTELCDERALSHRWRYPPKLNLLLGFSGCLCCSIDYCPFPFPVVGYCETWSSCCGLSSSSSWMRICSDRSCCGHRGWDEAPLVDSSLRIVLPLPRQQWTQLWEFTRFMATFFRLATRKSLSTIVFATSAQARVSRPESSSQPKMVRQFTLRQ